MSRVYATVSSKGQLVIPAAIREELGITSGTRVQITVEGKRLLLEPETVASKLQMINEMRGCTAGGRSMTESLLEDRRRERERELTEEGW